MKQITDSPSLTTDPLSSPYPALQAVLPRLASIGFNADDRPMFDTPEEVEEAIEDRNNSDALYVIPVWAINHTDLMSSRVVHWSYTQWLD